MGQLSILSPELLLSPEFPFGMPVDGGDDAGGRLGAGVDGAAGDVMAIKCSVTVILSP